jgi:hypothetical protein
VKIQTGSLSHSATEIKLMTTLPLRALHGPVIPGLARLVAAIDTVMAVFGEAQDMARAAQKRYPFIEG